MTRLSETLGARHQQYGFARTSNAVDDAMSISQCLGMFFLNRVEHLQNVLLIVDHLRVRYKIN